MKGGFWLVQYRRDHDRYAVSGTFWSVEGAKRRVDELLTDTRELRWLRLVQYHADSPATVLLDWKP